MKTGLPSTNSGDDVFFKAMDENPSAVYLVWSYEGVDRESLAIFSTKAKADDFCTTIEAPCAVCPFIIDDPGFGNRKTS